MANTKQRTRTRCVTGNATLTEVKAGKYVLPPFNGCYVVTGGWFRALGGDAGGATSVNLNDDTAAGHVVGVAVAVGPLNNGDLVDFEAASDVTRTTFGTAFQHGRGLLIEDVGASALDTCTSVDYCVMYQKFIGVS